MRQSTNELKIRKAAPVFRWMQNGRRVYLILASLALLMPLGCGGYGITDRVRFQNIAKTDVDMITDMHLYEIRRLIQQFTVKLYKKNPAELEKYPYTSISDPFLHSTASPSHSKKDEGIKTSLQPATMITMTSKRKTALQHRLRILEEKLMKIFQCPVLRSYPEIKHKRGVDAMLLGFEEEYKGDRVFAVMYGLYSMVMAAYNNRCELFMLDQLDQQKFYDSARNIEVLAWRLKTRKDKNNIPFLIANEVEGEVMNLSYERLLGKMIVIQDMMAIIISDSTNRLINKVVHTAGMSFLPIKL